MLFKVFFSIDQLSAGLQNLLFYKLFIGVAQFETNYDQTRGSGELVTGLIFPTLPQQHSNAFLQWVHPVEEKMFDPQKSQLVTGLTS